MTINPMPGQVEPGQRTPAALPDFPQPDVHADDPPSRAERVLASHLRVLRPDQHEEWMGVLARSRQYDFYHLPAYHALAELRGEGAPRLFVYEEGPHVIAIPLLLRPVSTALGLGVIGQGWSDATSVYGYPGPVASHDAVPAAILQGFQRALRAAWTELGVIAAFSRLHPLIPQRHLFDGFGECKTVGQTVAIDLTLPPQIQVAQYRENHRRGIDRLRRNGVVCLDDRHFTCLNDFMDIYADTMQRVHARPDYRFETAYFHELVSRLGRHMHLFVCIRDGQMINGGLFGICDGIVQYHLGGTRNDAVKLAPTKLLFDTVRSWAREQHAHTFHLGGGTGGAADSLLHFKAGFSERIHGFPVWRAVLAPDAYDLCCDERARMDGHARVPPASSDFFPAYRRPPAPGP